MKKAILIFLILALVLIPIFARTYTEEEFREVYDALSKTNELLKEKQAEVEELYNKITSLTELNTSLAIELENTTKLLNETDTLLQEAKKQLESSNKVINSLNNKNWVIGAHAGINNWRSVDVSPVFGGGIDLGYRIWLGYVLADFSLYSDKSYTIGLGYSFVL